MKKLIVKKCGQQGDVVMKKLDAMPNGNFQPVKPGKRGLVLADGEHTGHAHVVEADDAQLVREGERLLLILEKSATVVHEEHKPITLSPGIWEIGQVNEYDYLSEMTRKVVD